MRTSGYGAQCALLLALLGAVCVQARPDGAPSSACNDMVPGHPGDVQTSSPPYTIELSDTEYTEGQEITVTIRAQSGESFQGFFVQARTLFNDRTGSFRADSSDQMTQCDGEAVTHTSRDGKQSVTVTWVAGPPAGNIKFRISMVKDYRTYWTNIESDVVIDPTADPDITIPPPTEPTDPPTTDIDIDLDGCGNSKGCYRTPADCDIDKCDIAVTWSKQTDDSYVTFEMQGKTDGWIALGFSEDKSMGNDYAIMCLRLGDGSQVRTSYNEGRNNVALDEEDFGLSSIKRSPVVDGFIKCTFRREVDVSSVRENARRRRRAADRDAFIPLDQSYTLFLAQGPLRSSGGVSKHENRPLVSDARVDVTTDVVDVGSEPPDYTLYKLHGLFMISAWMLLISISLILARFYKPAFPDTTICGVQVWFAIHRAFNILAVALTIAAFVIIFVKVKGYTEISDDDPSYLKAHPVLGIIVTALAVLNPLMALCRPHPDEPSRPIFNWFHWGVGTTAHIAAIVAIFFGFNMPNSQPFIEDAGRDWVRYVLIGFCVLHVLVYIVLDIHRCRGECNQKEKYIQKELEMTVPGYQSTTARDSSEQSFGLRYALLVVYVLGTVGAFVAIVYGIASADTD